MRVVRSDSGHLKSFSVVFFPFLFSLLPKILKQFLANNLTSPPKQCYQLSSSITCFCLSWIPYTPHNILPRSVTVTKTS